MAYFVLIELHFNYIKKITWAKCSKIFLKNKYGMFDVYKTHKNILMIIFKIQFCGQNKV